MGRMQFPDGKNFGMNLRAARLGFRWSDSRKGYIRITEEAGNRFLIECCPADGVPSKARGQKMHFLWNESVLGDDGSSDDFLDSIECLKMVRKIRKHFWFYADEDGKLCLPQS